MFRQLFIALNVTLGSIVLAQGTPATITDPAHQISPSVTKHSIQLPSGTLNYTANAAQLPLRNAEGEVECRMFYVYYSKDNSDVHTRPVTFAFNGGPGSSTMWLHMGTLGPKRAPMMDDGSLPPPPYAPVENQETWLDFTDVVVIDAPATGLSRLTKPELGSKYFGVRPDIQAFTNFVKAWLTEHHRWSSPLFIAGESYGGIRGSGLSNSLFNAGIAVNGFISISGTNSFMTLDGMRGNDLPFIGFLPSLTACAWYHNKLARRFGSVEAAVSEAEKWVDATYGPALLRGDSLSPTEKDAIATGLSQYLGISKDFCLGANLRVNEFEFFKELLRKDGLVIGRLDGRLTGKEELKIGRQDTDDPSDTAITPPFTAAINEYLDSDLGLKLTIPYLNYGSVRPWKGSDGSYDETSSDLKSVLLANPHFRVLYACGYYDLACPFYATIYSLNHMGLDPESRSHVSFSYYAAGHMMYIEKGSRKKLHDDVRKFVGDSLAANKR